MELDKSNKGQDGGDKGAGLNLQQPGSPTSALEKITSGIEEGKQYAGADVLKVVQDALSADGREQKDRADIAEANLTTLRGDHDTLTTQLQTVSGQVTQLLQAKNEAEAEAVKEDAPALASLRVRQANTSEKLRLEGVAATLQARQVKLETDVATLTQEKTSVTIKLAAMAGGVDEKALANLVPDGNPERLANASKLLKQSGTPEIDPITGKPKPAGLTNTPASVLSAGGDARSVSEKMLEDAKAKK